MRDPDGSLEIHQDHVARSVRPDSPAARFLATDAARSLVASGRLVDYEFKSEGSLVAPRLPFVAHPFEWPDAQLARAAQLTIDVARAVLPAGHDLKDASAWNIVFRGTTPVFCDHLSFEPIVAREWWAFGQFVRHFVLPLGVAKLKGIHAYRAFQLARDGLAPALARELMGGRRFLSRYWPLVVDYRPRAPGARASSTGDPTAFRERIYRYCANAARAPNARRASHWSKYADERSHYSSGASRFKEQTVERWLGALRPAWVTDLGCNTGEYALLAQRCGAAVVVAVDYDHDCIEALFEGASGTVVHPVIADLGDLPGGRGWMGTETPGLMTRLAGRADVVICLALVHHLAVSESIPLAEIARLLAHLSKAHAVVEIIGEDDPMLVTLAAQRQRDPHEFAPRRQLDALAEFFTVEADEAIPETKRRIVLLRRRNGADAGVSP